MKAPPLSTEQIIHPEKFGTGEGADFPTSFTLPDLAQAIGAERLTTNTLGELFTRVLLAEKVEAATATRARGLGRRPLRVYAKAGAPDAVVWASTWDTPGDADEAEAALKSWLAALNPGKTSEDSDVTSARFTRPDGALDALARKGQDLFLLRGVPKDKIVPSLQKLFEETKKAERKKV